MKPLKEYNVEAYICPYMYKFKGGGVGNLQF